MKQEATSWYIQKNDLVEVNTGPEEGKRGRVLALEKRYNEVIVEGVNVHTKEVMDQESSPFIPEFTTVAKSRPIYFRDVSLVDPTTDTRTDVEWQSREGEDGKKRRVRTALGSGAEIPLPAITREWEGKEYADSQCTRRADVLAVTYVPLSDLPRRLGGAGWGGPSSVVYPEAGEGKGTTE